MKRFIGALALSVACFASAQAADYTLGQITITDPWIRATPGKARNGAGYLQLHNAGPDDRLIAVRSNVSDRTELHTHIADNGVMRMRRIEGGIELPHGGTTVLEPHGKHVMLMGLDAPLKEGGTVHLTFTFQRAGEIAIDVPIMPVGHMGAMHKDKMHKDTMGKDKMDHAHGMKKGMDMKKDMQDHGHGSDMKAPKTSE